MFPGGFQDETYLAWERDYKWTAHETFRRDLNRVAFRALLGRRRFSEIAAHAVRIESRTNLLFSFEKMALKDAVKTPRGAKAFAEGLYDVLHGTGPLERRFSAWRDTVGGLPRVKTRVLTWPTLTVFPFLAQPEVHFFFKPLVTRAAARAYGVELPYQSRPSFEVYAALLAFAATVKSDLADLGPRDQVDVQSFLWVQGSPEYEE